MISVVQGLQNPTPMHEAPQCGVCSLFSGNVQLTGSFSISLLFSPFFRRVRRG